MSDYVWLSSGQNNLLFMATSGTQILSSTSRQQHHTAQKRSLNKPSKVSIIPSLSSQPREVNCPKQIHGNDRAAIIGIEAFLPLLGSPMAGNTVRTGTTFCNDRVAHVTSCVHNCCLRVSFCAAGCRDPRALLRRQLTLVVLGHVLLDVHEAL